MKRMKTNKFKTVKHSPLITIVTDKWIILLILKHSHTMTVALKTRGCQTLNFLKEHISQAPNTAWKYIRKELTENLQDLVKSVRYLINLPILDGNQVESIVNEQLTVS